MKYLKNKKNNGFTIIETMISVSLFVIITTLGMGTLLNAHAVYKKSQDMRSIIDSLNFVMEDMSRNIRTGYNYRCFYGVAAETGIPTTDPEPSSLGAPRNCASGWGIAFEYAYGDNTENDVPTPDPIDYGDQWIYYISGDGKLFKSTDGPYVEASFTQLTPDEIFIDPATSFFIVEGAENTDTLQPLVTIRLVGTITYKNVVSPFTLETSVSQRILDI